jgi:gluconokinase
MAAKCSAPPRWDAAIVVMGVSGAGKTTIAKRLAERLDLEMLEGDALHPSANIEKMSHGIPLGDEDRLPWLKAIAARIDVARKSERPIIVTCSALKRNYRATLAEGKNDVGFVYLKGPKALIAQRLAARRDHFMPAQMLDSQFAALEEPAADEHAIIVPIEPSPEEIVDEIVTIFTAKRPA